VSAKPLHRFGTGRRRYLFIVAFTAAFLSTLPWATADELRIEEVTVEQQVAEVAKFGYFSLLGDEGHSDQILQVASPSGSTANSYLAVLADGNFLVPIERLEEEDEGYQYDTHFFFDSSIHGDCVHSEARLYRKFADNKVIGVYAIQWHEWPGEIVPEDFRGFDDLRNARIVYEIFQFERRKSAPEWDYPRFRKIAEKRIVVQSCEEARIGDDIIRLIREH
jgi:hypothetical protein